MVPYRYLFVSLLIIVFGMLFQESLYAQSLTAVNADRTETTLYPTFSANDPIYYFCSQEGVAIASLTAKSRGAVVSFLWEKFDPATSKFLTFSNETAASSTKSNLADGCYRVTFSENGLNSQYRAWVFNSWSRPAASIVESKCTLLRLSATVTGAIYQYYDLATAKPVVISSETKFRWYAGNQYVASVQSPSILTPPSKNTDYRVEVTDRSGCVKSAVVSYNSPIPVASFSWTTPQKNDPQFVFPQAPANIDFKNLSENSDPDKFEWFLFKDKKVIDEMGGGTTQVDSFLTILYDANPLYTYERSGQYKVKLIAAKTVQALTCRDTFYLPDYIIVDTSLVKVAPVFTPNGDGVNDKLILKTRSLESLDFTIVNRWGKMVHHYSTNNYIPTDTEIAAWDGRVNGNLCPAGVYFYVVDARGRDGVRRRSKGFVEMIW